MKNKIFSLFCAAFLFTNIVMPQSAFFDYLLHKVSESKENIG
jgi:hypothetical protein